MENSELKQKIYEALKLHFPEETVDVSDGYLGKVHILVVSHKFDNMSEQDKQDYLWSLVGQSGLSEAEKVKISRILPWSPAELK